jgi:hypothetical protein
MTDLELQKLAKTLKANYKREWNRKNPDKVKKNNDNFWLRQAKKVAGQMSENEPVKTISETPKQVSVTDSVTSEKVSVTPKQDSVTSNCQYCNSQFEAMRTTAKFCSDSCRVSHNRKAKTQ